MSLPANLGRLRQVQRIGAGGFATVWLYQDDELDSPVAVKALADNWATRSDIRDRFLEEARILRRADSDHVVRVYDIGETESGTPYFVMSYADRGTVANLIDAGPIALSEVVTVVNQAAMGLQVLHDHGVIHRDIKPQNLLLRGNGARTRLMVADLGMAKAMLHASGLTQVVGTPAYMAPEQATGVGLSHRADIYGLGAVAYRLLTGRVVREGALASIPYADPPAPPSSVASIPPALDAVVMRALDPEPGARWHDAASFARAFSDAAGAAPDETAPRGIVRIPGAAPSTPDIGPLPPGATWPPGATPADPIAGTPTPSGAAQTPGVAQSPPAGVPEATPATIDPEPRQGMRTALLAVLALIVLAATFAAAYLITRQLR